jgi:hypothetical protein
MTTYLENWEAILTEICSAVFLWETPLHQVVQLTTSLVQSLHFAQRQSRGPESYEFQILSRPSR